MDCAYVEFRPGDIASTGEIIINEAEKLFSHFPLF